MGTRIMSARCEVSDSQVRTTCWNDTNYESRLSIRTLAVLWRQHISTKCSRRFQNYRYHAVHGLLLSRTPGKDTHCIESASL